MAAERRRSRTPGPPRAVHGITLDRLNTMPEAEAVTALLDCCASREWARRVVAARPFRDRQALFDTADRMWLGLARSDWMEAFRAHPRIGESKGPTEASARQRSWSKGEQERSARADDALRAELASLNDEYEAMFGFIFIICAAGLGTKQIINAMLDRMRNDGGTELRVAAGEQAKITRLRLEKLLA